LTFFSETQAKVRRCTSSNHEHGLSRSKGESKCGKNICLVFFFKLLFFQIEQVRRIDSQLERIMLTCKYCAVYQLENGQWEKKDIEGPLHLCRSTTYWKLIVTNRKTPENWLQDITSDMRIERQGQYVFYNGTVHQSSAVGLWFYEGKDSVLVANMLETVIAGLASPLELGVPKPQTTLRRNKETNTNNEADQTGEAKRFGDDSLLPPHEEDLTVLSSVDLLSFMCGDSPTPKPPPSRSLVRSEDYLLEQRQNQSRRGKSSPAVFVRTKLIGDPAILSFSHSETPGQPARIAAAPFSAEQLPDNTTLSCTNKQLDRQHISDEVQRLFLSISEAQAQTTGGPTSQEEQERRILRGAKKVPRCQECTKPVRDVAANLCDTCLDESIATKLFRA
jgi:hypothetical protein